MNAAGITESGQYLSFTIDEEEFALDISRVREVLDLVKITRIPQTPNYIRGAINLRNSVVSVVDLKDKFGVGNTEKTTQTRIIICDIETEYTSSVIGILADSVHEVIEIEPQDIEPTPRIGTKFAVEALKGMAKRNEDIIMIMNVDKVFTIEDLALVDKTGSAPIVDTEMSLCQEMATPPS